METGSAFQSLMDLGEKLCLYSVMPLWSRKALGTGGMARTWSLEYRDKRGHSMIGMATMA
jgi:hypothetical protein